MTRQQFTACLIAGGKSSRMGRDKAGVKFSGEMLWLHQLRILRETGADEILISGRKDACYANCGVGIIEDEIKNAGPLAGINSALSAASHPLALILAIDMPQMTGAYLRGLCEQCTGQSGVVPKRDGFYEGLAAIFPKSAGAVAAKILASDDYSIQHFVCECACLDLVKIVRVSDIDTALFQNLNSPSDFPKPL
jgi:molybdenum cofactor guanylyltransferase